MKTLIAALCGLLLAWVVVLPAQANTLDFDSLTMGSTGITSISLNSIAINTTDANGDKTLAISAGTVNSAYANLPEVMTLRLNRNTLKAAGLELMPMEPNIPIGAMNAYHDINTGISGVLGLEADWHWFVGFSVSAMSNSPEGQYATKIKADFQKESH